MMQRSIISAGVLVVALGVCWPIALVGQSTKIQPGAVAKTEDGHPDIQGLWLFSDPTPIETPGTPTRRRVGEDRDTAGSADAAQRAVAQRRVAARGGENEVNPFYSERPIGRNWTKRPSLVIDPPDGKVPVLPGPIEKNNEKVDHFADSYLFLNPAERCITYGVPGSQFPTRLSASLRILQSPGVVGFSYEQNGPRIIPVDGSPHLPQNIRMWNGDSRGHWEGNTLVIEITNYNGQGQLTHNPDRLQGIINSTALRVVERYTPVDANTLNYEVTVEDPNTYSRPWKAALQLFRDDGSYRVFEYVCHEGNYKFMTLVLGGGRLKDKGAGAETAVASPTRKAAEEAAKAGAK